MDNRPENQSTGLKKELSPLSVWALAFGCIIGWGSFFNPGLKFLPAAGPLGTAIAMLAGAAIMIVIACSYNYLIPHYPTAGGEFSYTLAVFDAKHAFVCGWFLVLAYIANVPSNATAFGYMTRFLFDGAFSRGYLYSVSGYQVYMGEVLVSATAIIILSVFSVRGIKVAGVVECIFAFSLAICVVIIAAAAVLSPVCTLNKLSPMFSPNAQSTSEAVKEVVSILAIAPWAFVGFDTIPQTCEEFNFSHKKVFGIMIVAILFGAFVYISNTLVAATAIQGSYTDAINDPSISWLLGSAVKNILGTPGVIILGIALSCAILTGLLGFLTASSRLMYAMACAGFLPEPFGRLHPEYGTPKNALLFCMAVSLAGPFFGRVALGWFVDMAAIGAAIGFGYTCCASALTIKELRDVKNWRGLSALGWLGTVFSCIFIIMFLPGMPAALDIPSLIMLVIWIVLGVAFYFARKDKVIEFTEGQPLNEA